jgi:hypothetical protein
MIPGMAALSGVSIGKSRGFAIGLFLFLLVVRVGFATLGRMMSGG